MGTKHPSGGINLLPASAKKRLTRNYYVTLSALFLFVGSLAIFAGSVLLIPSYFFAKSQADAAERYRAASEGAVKAETHAGATTTLAAFAEGLTAMQTYAAPPLIGSALSALTESIPSGVYLTTVTIGSKANAPVVLIEGIAQTRQGLLAYVAALQKQTLFSGVAIPVAELANETDVHFSLSFAITLPSL